MRWLVALMLVSSASPALADDPFWQNPEGPRGSAWFDFGSSILIADDIGGHSAQGWHGEIGFVFDETSTISVGFQRWTETFSVFDGRQEQALDFTRYNLVLKTRWYFLKGKS
jgi:hypothetical protein